LMRTGALPYVRVGSFRRIRPADARAFLESTRVTRERHR
jgi:hypothetical protein